MYGSFRVAGELFPELARLQQQLDDVFQGSWGPSNIRALAQNGYPAVNVGASPDTIEVLAFVPGIEPNELQITIDKGLLSIAGERRSESSKREAETVYAKERFVGSFKRVLSLPEDADPAKVDATFRDGLLHITIAKRESSRPRQISVN
jgi:HSP20 family protein